MVPLHQLTDLWGRVLADSDLFETSRLLVSADDGQPKACATDEGTAIVDRGDDLGGNSCVDNISNAT